MAVRITTAAVDVATLIAITQDATSEGDAK